MNILLGTAKDWFAAALKAVLEPEGFEVRWATGRDDLLQMAATGRPEAVLLDEALVGEETPQLCRELVAEALDDSVPLLLYASGVIGESLYAEAYEAGVWSIFEEPIRARLLVAALRRFLAIGSRARHRGAELAPEETEPLDRSALERLLPVLRAAASREAAPLSCVVIGPTRLGTGELLQRQRNMTAELCGRHLRSSDLFGWMDGSDIAILAFGAGSLGAEALVRRLNEAAAGRADVDRETAVLSAGIFELPASRNGSEARWTGGESDDGLQVALRALGKARAAGGGVQRWEID